MTLLFLAQRYRCQAFNYIIFSFVLVHLLCTLITYVYMLYSYIWFLFVHLGAYFIQQYVLFKHFEDIFKDIFHLQMFFFLHMARIYIYEFVNILLPLLLHAIDCYALATYATEEGYAIYYMFFLSLGVNMLLVGWELFECGMAHCTDVRCITKCF